MESLRENWRAVRRRGNIFLPLENLAWTIRIRVQVCAIVPGRGAAGGQSHVSPEASGGFFPVLMNTPLFWSGFLEPVADRLEKLLEPWARRAEPLAKDWEIYYRSPAAREQLQQRSCCSIDNSVETICLNLRYLQPKAGPGVMDDETGTVYFHTGVAQAVERKTPLDFEDWGVSRIAAFGESRPDEDAPGDVGAVYDISGDGPAAWAPPGCGGSGRKKFV